MPPYHLIAFDIDDCLMPLNRPPQDGVVAALQRLVAADVRLVFASGKPCVYLAGLARGLGLMDTSLIGENGAEIWLGSTMPAERLAQPLGADELAGLANVRRRVAERYGDRVFLQPNTVNVTAFPGPGAPTPEQIAAEVGPGDPVALQQFVHSDSVDWAVRRFSKGAALSLLAAHLGVPRARLAAAGDSGNDLSMLPEVNLPLWLGDPARLGDVSARVVSDITAALALLQEWVRLP